MTKPHTTHWPDGTPRSTANAFAWRERLAALLAIGVLIWRAMPRRNARERDIERQIATLRQGADHAVRHRPRVRANGCAATPGHLKAVPKAEKPKACGGGQCRHRADCSDHYCPGRLSASLTAEARHARR